MDNKTFANSLRLVADMYEKHETLPQFAATFTIYPRDTKESLQDISRILKPCNKEYNDTLLTLTKDIGGIPFHATFFRETACKKKEVGVKVVKRKKEVVPAVYEEVEEEQPVYEWECESLLGS